MSEQQTVTVSFFRYQGFGARWEAFTRMGRSRQLLRGIEGLQFAKMLGSGGGNGFSIRPNLGVYSLLASWESEAAAERFFQEHPVGRAMKATSAENWTLFMHTAKSHGSWDGVSPFEVNCAYDEDAVVGVVTRGAIKSSQLLRFWKYVPRVSRSVVSWEGLLFSSGIGEVPLFQLATFSLWQNTHAMKACAYEKGFHKTAVRRTRETGWFREELFARFHPFRSEGSWAGSNPLEAAGTTRLPQP